MNPRTESSPNSVSVGFLNRIQSTFNPGSKLNSITITLAQEINGNALFARREQDLTTEIQRNPFDINILFLDNQEEH
jgi:hypothetical protein